MLSRLTHEDLCWSEPWEITSQHSEIVIESEVPFCVCVFRFVYIGLKISFGVCISILFQFRRAWRTIQSMGLQRVGHEGGLRTHTFQLLIAVYVFLLPFSCLLHIF